MTSQSDDASSSLRLQKLMAELETSGSREDAPRPAPPQRPKVDPFSILVRWLGFGAVCLGVGFWVGSQQARLRWSLNQPAERELLIAQGWRQDSGVFYRWCQGACQAPRLYGGGVLQVFEVKCVDRPCGDLAMRFNVLNSRGEVIDRIALDDRGLQGETRRFLVESTRVDAGSIELSDFSARARV